jgi:Domain of unknown function (DUF1990)
MDPQQRPERARARARKLITGRVLPSLLLALLAGLGLRALAARRRPRPVPQEVLWGRQRVQLPGEGYGLLFHRRYYVDLQAPRLRMRSLMDRIKAELRDFSPRVLADFQKVKGDPRVMQVGDEYQITILGPWNGDVRVAEVGPTSFTFVTLEGHPEAGQITFSLCRRPLRPWVVRFEISSWARSRDMLVSLGYHEGKLGKEIQKNAWVTFCERVVEASGGRAYGKVEVITEERDEQGEVVPVV